MDPHLEEAARDLGASSFGAFWHVTLPLIAPAVGAGAMLAFALSFDDLVVTSFNAGVGSTTLPIFIYSSIKFGVTPQINAISTIIVAVVAVALFIAWRLGTFRGDDLRPAAEAEPARSLVRLVARSPVTRGRRDLPCDRAAGSSATGRPAGPRPAPVRAGPGRPPRPRRR